MIKKLFTLMLVSCSFVASAQFGIEANYGLNGSYEPSYNGFTHFGAGITYEFDDKFGAKLDFGIDDFSVQNDVRGTKTGVSNFRVTAQGTINLSSLADTRAFYNKFNVIAHGGAGISILNSDIADNQKTDHLLNLVFGITPRYEVAENFFLTADFSFVANVSQHYLFNGEVSYDGPANSFTGLMYNASLGMAYKFGK
ncbi:outer membrane beta-barrel protein [Flavobacterium difficile]|uniref:Porin family protein n=1 Tax=Flavobacterium difficile TaxID=2709659 RepID=A0ABX0I588_9FLAO|nr:outer membrane beta-barrel protein [Flavobacterium difficile]NHM00927.1 porin family protein [Flavobacterium difficile]